MRAQRLRFFEAYRQRERATPISQRERGVGKPSRRARPRHPLLPLPELQSVILEPLLKDTFKLLFEGSPLTHLVADKETHAAECKRDEAPHQARFDARFQTRRVQRRTELPKLFVWEVGADQRRLAVLLGWSTFSSAHSRAFIPSGMIVHWSARELVEVQW